MHPLEQKDVLESFRILIDTREQPTDRARQRYNTFGVPYERATLDYGDYTYNCTLPDGRFLHDCNSSVSGLCVVERKMNLDELSQCFTRERERFKREFQRAQEHDSRVYLLVENATWENLLNGKYRTRFHANAFTASAVAWMVRYNANLVFCKEETSGRLIKEILYRDLKERLERGDFG